MSRDMTSTWARLATLAVAILLPLEILCVMVWLFMPFPGFLAIIPLAALGIGLAGEKRAAYWIGAPVFVIQGIANILVLLSKLGGLWIMISDGRLVAESLGSVAFSLAVNAVAVALVVLFFSRGVRSRFFCDDLLPRI